MSADNEETTQPGVDYSTHRRKESWPEDLAAFIETRRFRAFEWGVHDCTLFAADAINVVVGIDPASAYRGQYDSALSGMAILNGLGGIEEAFKRSAYENGFVPVAVGFAHQGDIVLCDDTGLNDDSGPALGVCLGVMSAFVGPNGLVFLPTLKSCRLAWRID